MKITITVQTLHKTQSHKTHNTSNPLKWPNKGQSVITLTVLLIKILTPSIQAIQTLIKVRIKHNRSTRYKCLVTIFSRIKFISKKNIEPSLLISLLPNMDAKIRLPKTILKTKWSPEILKKSESDTFYLHY